MKAMFTKTINLPKCNFQLHPKYNELEPANMEAITTGIFSTIIFRVLSISKRSI